MLGAVVAWPKRRSLLVKSCLLLTRVRWKLRWGGLRVSRPLAPVRASAAAGHSANASRLSGRLLVVARVVWIALALAAVSLFIAAVPAEFAQLDRKSVV